MALHMPVADCRCTQAAKRFSIGVRHSEQSLDYRKGIIWSTKIVSLDSRPE
jgi:hypothetical protein